MATPVSKVIDQFLFRIRCYEFMNYLPEELDQMIDSYLKTSVGHFLRWCKTDLTIQHDEENNEFSFVGNLSEEEVDILATGMMVEWIKPYLYKSENFKNSMNTKDYSYFSPANLLKEIRDTYTNLKTEFDNKIVLYTYHNNDLYDLSVD